MRVLLLSRIHPLPGSDIGDESTSLGARLHRRIGELAALGHEILVLTMWRGEAVGFDLPKNASVLMPFRQFKFWEWPTALPVAVRFAPDAVHVVDPGLPFAERSVSVEASAVPMLEVLNALRRAAAKPRLQTVLSTSGGDLGFWRRVGFQTIESSWLTPKPTIAWTKTVLTEPNLLLEQERVRIALPKQTRLAELLEALSIMHDRPDFELVLPISRAALSATDRKRLARAERQIAFAEAVGARLQLVDAATKPTAIPADVALLAGLDDRTTRNFLLDWHGPAIVAEDWRPDRSFADSEWRLQRVPRFAWLPLGIAAATHRENLHGLWSKLHRGELADAAHAGTDDATNRISRLYSGVADDRSEP